MVASNNKQMNHFMGDDFYRQAIDNLRKQALKPQQMQITDGRTWSIVGFAAPA
jgi:hypothetical protein